MVSEALASVLRSGRDNFNAGFAEARRAHPDLDGAVFAEFLRTTVDELARAVEAVRPECLANVVSAAYETGLELVGQRLLGPAARERIVEKGWRRIFPKVASLLAIAPERLLSAVSNALHQLAATPGARADQWIDEMERIGPQCSDVETFLIAGQVIAWRAGLAHYRTSAIAAADALPKSLAIAAIGAPSAAQWDEVRSRLHTDPWFDPAQPASNGSTPRPRLVAQAGVFRGYGGLFIEPPRVTASDGHFLVRSGDECWLLMVDVFGATFHRVGLEEFVAASKRSDLPPALRINGSAIAFEGTRFEVGAWGEFTSAAANATTLALTSPLTHSVLLVALPIRQ